MTPADDMPGPKDEDGEPEVDEIDFEEERTLERAREQWEAERDEYGIEVNERYRVTRY